MDLVEIYKCLADETRLRIINLLSVSPLCVCHLQQVLGKSQVLISKHLGCLRERKLVVSQAYQNWRIYSLTPSPTPELEAHLGCLSACAQTEPVLRGDRAELQKLMGNKTVRALLDGGCCPKPTNQ